MKTNSITTSDEIIDSRDVLSRIEDLRGELDALLEAIADTNDAGEKQQAKSDLINWLGLDDSSIDGDIGPDELAAPLSREWCNSDESNELAALEALAEDAEGYSADWRHGTEMIREDYFPDYARQLAEDIGAIQRDMAWPCNHINWDAAAEELKQDYTSVDFDGTTYLIQ